MSEGIVVEILPGKWTRPRLAALSVSERHNVWKNARRLGTPPALRLLEVIEDLGLPYFDSRCLTNDDPITVRMYEVINSPDGKAACVKATADGLPAIAGVDGMLNNALGIDYQAGNMATMTAGSLVGEIMRALGYDRASQRQRPKGSVAKSGVFWTPREGRQSNSGCVR